MQVDKRTIQRDIDDIRSHFFDSEEYGGQRLEVTYSHQDNSYFLDGEDTRQNNHTFKMLLLLIRSSTPVINQDIHQLLETMILTQYEQDNKDLLKVLNSFNINKSPLPIENIQHVNNAMEQSHSLYHHDHQTEVDPHALGLQFGDFTPQVSQKNKIYDYKLNEHTFTSTDTPSKDKIQTVTFEIEKSLWQSLKDTVSVTSVETVTNQSVVATLKMNVNDALILSYTHAPLVRLTDPTPVKDMITNKLIAMIDIYVNQSINTKEHK